MPSSAMRSCGIIGFLRVRTARLTSSVARNFKPAAPELPLSTLDLRTPTAVTWVLEDATEDEHLVHSPQLEFPRFRDQEAFQSVHSTVEEFQEIANSSTALEFASPSPILSCPSSPLLTAPPHLIQMSSPSIYCPSLFDSEHSAIQDNSLPALTVPSIGELGKRRGFKGAPLFTPETAKKRSTSFLSLSSAFSPKTPLSPRPSPSTPRTIRLIPSTPRTPLATVTNLIRTPTAKSAKPLGMLMECSVSEELQECYDQADPFSATGESFYSPEIVCASVPFSNLERLDGYRAALPNTAPVRSHKTFFKALESASRSKHIRIWPTNIYDMMVYNFQPNVELRPKKKAGKSTRRLRLAQLAPLSLRCSPTTKACLMFLTEETRVLLPRHVERNCEAFPAHLCSPIHPVPADFCFDWPPSTLWDLQTIVSIPQNAAIRAQIAPTRQSTDAVAMDAATAAILSRRSVAPDLLPSPDMGLKELETNVQPISSEGVVAV